MRRYLLRCNLVLGMYETPTAGFGEHYAVQPDGLPGQPAEEHQHEVPHPGQGALWRVWIHGR